MSLSAAGMAVPGCPYLPQLPAVAVLTMSPCHALTPGLLLQPLLSSDLHLFWATSTSCLQRSCGPLCSSLAVQAGDFKEKRLWEL